MGNQQRCPDEGSVQRPHGMSPEAGFWYSLLPGESRGTQDYDKPGTYNLHPYEVIPLEADTPASYERVFKSSGTKVFPNIVNDGGTVSDLSDGGKKYSFSGGSGSGYKKSTITLTGHTGVNRTSGSATIRFYTENGSNIYADAGSLGTVAATSMTLTYTVSTPPSGGQSGSVTVYPMTKFDQKAIKPAWVESTPATSKTKTFLMQGGTTAIQNFAFDMDAEMEEELWTS